MPSPDYVDLGPMAGPQNGNNIIACFLLAVSLKDKVGIQYLFPAMGQRYFEDLVGWIKPGFAFIAGRRSKGAIQGKISGFIFIERHKLDRVIKNIILKAPLGLDRQGEVYQQTVKE